MDICTLWVDTLGEITTGFTCDVRAIGGSKRLERTSAGWKAAHPEVDYKSADNMRYRLTYGKVLTKKKGYFLDRDFVCFDASEAVVCGENQLVIGAVCGRTAPVIEDVYLLGDFSCRIEDTDVRVLTETVTAISDTSFPEKQGYPFFTGELCLKNSFELPYGARNAELELCGVDASAVAVIINGTAAEPLVGAPWKRDISDLVTRGINTIELRCVGTLRNLLGPTHNTTAEKRSVGPGDYNDKSRWSDEPIFRSTGFGKAKINYNAF